MNNQRTPYNPTPGDYDTDKLTDLHSSETDPSSYARNLKQDINRPRTKDSFNSSERSAKRESELNLTERIPTIAKYSDMNTDDDKFDYKGEI